VRPPAVALAGGYAAGHLAGIPEVTSATYLASSALCIAAIACLSQQSSARTGNTLGMIGVGGGIAATLGSVSTGASPETMVQIVGALGAGGAIGNYIAK
jgi:NAD(P) transhydrogenase